MLAGHIYERGKIRLVETDEPSLGNSAQDEGQIIFQPELACLCGSDLPYFDSDHYRYPLEVGYSLHEMVGHVVDSRGQRYRPGDRVLAVPVRQHGFFERFRVSERRAIPLDLRVPPEEALLAQPLGTVLYALRKLPALLGLNVAIVGQGPIGQLFCAAVRNLGAKEIIAIDRLASRLALSTTLGATATIDNSREDPVEAVLQVTRGTLPEVVIEAVGHDDVALNLCLDLCARGGRILSFGVPPEEVDGLRWKELFYKNITVYTSVDPDFEIDFPLAMRWIGEGRVKLAPIITHRFAVGDIQQAFETFRDRVDGAQKVLVRF